MGSSRKRVAIRTRRGYTGAGTDAEENMSGPILAGSIRASGLDGAEGECTAVGASRREPGFCPPPSRPGLRALVGAGVSVVAVLLLAWAYSRWKQGGIHLGQIATTVASLDGRWLAGAGVLALGTYLLRALRWRLMMASLRPRARIGSLVAATVIGFTAVVLFGRAGEVVRPYVVARKEGVTMASQLGLWTIERLYDLLATLALFGYALTRLPDGAKAYGSGAGYFAMVAAGLCIALLVVLSAYGRWAESRLAAVLEAMPATFRRFGGGGIRGFLAGLAAVRSRRVHLGLVAYTVAEWLLVTAACWCLFRSSSWSSSLGWADTFAFVGWVSMGGIVQLPGLGGGVQIAATVALTEIYGLPVEASLSLAMALWVVGFALIVPLGVTLGLREGVNWLTMRKASCQVAA